MDTPANPNIPPVSAPPPVPSVPPVNPAVNPPSPPTPTFTSEPGQTNTQTQKNINSSNVGDATKNSKATTGLILSIFGLIAWLVPIIGAPVTIIGLVFSIKGIKSLKRRVAIAGIVLSSIGLLATVINASIGAYQGATGQNMFINKYINQENGTTYTNIQTAPQNHKDFSNICYKSKIADPSNIVDENCSLIVTGVDSTLPYIKVNAIISGPGEDAKWGLNLGIKEYSKNMETSVDENASVSGYPAYLLRYRDNAFKYRTYFLDVPKDSNYLIDGQRIDVIMINGFDGDPNVDIFTKEMDIFLKNFKF